MTTILSFYQDVNSINQSINQSTFVKRHKSRANRRRVIKLVLTAMVIQTINKQWLENERVPI